MSAVQSPLRFRLYLISDRRLAGSSGGLLAAIETALAGAAEVEPPGSVAVQLREKDLEARALYELAGSLRSICSRFRSPFILNDRVDVAIAAHADGVHLASTSFTVADARALLGRSGIIGVSAHGADEVTKASDDGADFAVFGPVYDPTSKAAYGPAKGLAALSDAVKAAQGMPLYALGGINPSRTAEIAALPSNSRPSGIAVIGAVLGSTAPGAAVRDLLHSFKTL